MAMNSPSGGVDLLKKSSPQQAKVPSVLTPHVWSSPVLTEENGPLGGVALPSSSLSPARPRCRLILTPQVCSGPVLTEVNSPSGGVASPSSSLPQQATVPSVITPQV